MLKVGKHACARELPGFLTSGLLPCVSHCLDNLMLPESIVIPAAATVYAQAVEISTAPVCELQLSGLDAFRCALSMGMSSCLSTEHKQLGAFRYALDSDLRDTACVQGCPLNNAKRQAMHPVLVWYLLETFYHCQQLWMGSWNACCQGI